MPQYHGGLLALFEDATAHSLTARTALQRNDALLSELKATSSIVAGLHTNQIEAAGHLLMVEQTLRIIRAEITRANGAKE